MDFYQRKFHIEHKLPDGNIYKGFINVEADTREELHTIDEIKGTYYIEKIPEGWLGRFQLDSNDADRRKCGTQDNNYVITIGVYKDLKPRKTAPVLSTAEAEEILASTQPIKYERIERFTARLEDDITSEETHHWT